MKRLLIITPLLSLLLLSLGCKKEDDSNANPDDNKGKKELPEISVWDISNKTEWDLQVLGTKNKDRYYIEETNSKPTKAIYYSEQKDNHYSVEFDNEGLPDKVVVDDYIFVFENHSGNKVDIGVVKPNDETEIVRNVETEDYNWDKIKAGLGKKARDDEAVTKWTSRALEAIPCAISVASLFPTGGGSAPAVVTECGTYLLGLGLDIAAENTDIKALEDAAETYDMASTSIECASGAYSCITNAASKAVSDYSGDLSITTGSVKEVENELEGNQGSGDKPVADFRSDKTTVKVGQAVNFTDLSDNNPTSWSWEFGDGSTSSKQNPSHTYSSSGNYTVTLTASNSEGSDVETKQDFITVQTPNTSTVTIQPGPNDGKDAEVNLTRFPDGSETYSGEGSGKEIFISYFEANGGEKNGLFKFPLGKVPSNATIVSGKLRLFGSVSTNRSNADNVYFTISRLLGSWNESSVAWNNKPSYKEITSNKIPYVVNPKIEFDLTSTLQKWINGSINNHGIAISPSGSGYDKEMSVKSSEHQNASKRPKLVIEYY